MKFKLISKYKPAGDQPQAIESITENLKRGVSDQVLLGVTGSGKTFTIANVIERIGKPVLIISHNKTLSAQLYQEFKEYFPKNAVEYFVSYYDYYQPESYLPATDTYIEKEADINKDIEKLRLRATASLMARRDVIVVSSVSCIYNLGSPKEYKNRAYMIEKKHIPQEDLLKNFINNYYERSNIDFTQGKIRVLGEVVDIWPAYEEHPVRITYNFDSICAIEKIDPFTGKKLQTLDKYILFPAKHYITNKKTFEKSLREIEIDLRTQLENLRKAGKNIEAHRLEQRTNYDLEMMRELGYCTGIENYSRYFDGRGVGDAPSTLLDFFGDDYLLIIDESHITLPQIRGMYKGDQSRKNTLVEHGFRLPSAIDNRPLNFEEFLDKKPQTVYVSATPGDWEVNRSDGIVVEQLIRPTGILDPDIFIKPAKDQIADVICRIKKVSKKKGRSLVITLTKKMAEDLSEYLSDIKGLTVQYLHSDIGTLERTEILSDLRNGKYDVLVGINLLREGLDLPEVSLVAILDADKEGFLRSDTSLIQIMGRASRNIDSEVVLYADTITGSIERAVKEVRRRRIIQERYNKKHGVTPKTIVKPFRSPLIRKDPREEKSSIGMLECDIEDYEFRSFSKSKRKRIIKTLELLMKDYAQSLEFEKAVILRDKVLNFKKLL